MSEKETDWLRCAVGEGELPTYDLGEKHPSICSNCGRHGFDNEFILNVWMRSTCVHCGYVYDAVEMERKQHEATKTLSVRPEDILPSKEASR